MYLLLTLSDDIFYGNTNATYPRLEYRFTIDGTPQRDKRGRFIKVGSFAANLWINVAMGKTEKQTLANAKRKLTAMLKKNPNLTFTFEYVKE